MASDTIAFIPWISETTVTIDVTATMLPSTVMQRSELVRPDRLRASEMDSRICTCVACAIAYLGQDSTLTGEPSAQLAHRVERAGDHLVAGLQSEQHLEVALAGDADLDGLEHDAAVAEDEHAFRLLARLPGRRLRRRRGGAPRPGACRTHCARTGGGGSCTSVPCLVEQHLAHGERLDRHRDDVAGASPS